MLSEALATVPEIDEVWAKAVIVNNWAQLKKEAVSYWVLVVVLLQLNADHSSN